MYIYTITTVANSLAVTSFNDSYSLTSNDMKLVDSLLIRHGLSELNGFVFYSTYDTFAEAFEFLLFGRVIDNTIPDWILRNILVPAILDQKEPDFRGIPKKARHDYIKYELDSTNIEIISSSPYYQASKWIRKINNYIKITDIILRESQPFGLEHGIYFVATNQRTNIETKYVFLLDSCELKICI